MADSIEQERFIIATEQAQIRAYLRKCDSEMRPSIVSKLIFLDMLGQNPVWGQMETITLMTDERFSYKRVGYIGASILLDETTELTVLVTHTLLKDLQNVDPNIQCLALTFIANLGSAEVCRSVATEVQKLMGSRFPMVQKRAGMAVLTIVRKNPDLCESYKNSVQSLLNQSSHGVVIAGINLVLEMIKIEPKLTKSWSQFSIPFTKILKSLSNSRPTREFSSGVYNDPFMQIKAMQALCLLKKRPEEIEGILQSIISSTEYRRNTGRAILYQAVETIVAVSKKPALRGLAFNQVGRLLSMKDPNVLYSALSAFARVLYSENAITRGSADSMALQRYKSQIVNCLDHKDPSIRRRALDVISALIDEKNVETLVPEILSFIKLSEAEFRSELISKIFAATQRFAPSVEWNFDTVHQILIDSGNYVSSDIISSFCEMITKTPSIQPHAVQKLSDSLLHFSDNQALMQVSAFVIGEFALEDNGVFESLKQIIVMPQTIFETQLYIITAISKLVVRLSVDRTPAIKVLGELVKSNNLEVQQRSGEMIKVLSGEGVAEQLLAPISPTGEGENEEKNLTIIDNAADDQEDLLLIVLDQSTNQPKPSVNSTPVTPAPLVVNKEVAPKPEPTPVKPNGVELVKFQDFIIYGQTMKNPKDPRQIALNLIIVGTCNRDLTSFSLEYKVPSGWQIQIRPADKNVLSANGQMPITQVLYLFNPGSSQFSIQVSAKYQFGSQPVSETGVIRSLE